MGGSGHHFGALLGASGSLLGVLGAPWELLGDPWGPLWAPFAGTWGALAAIWVHFGSIFGDFGLQCGSEGSLLHDVGSCGVIFHYFLQELCTILCCFSRLPLFYLLVVISGLLSLCFSCSLLAMSPPVCLRIAVL